MEAGFIVLAIFAAIVIRILAGGMDRDRLARYIQQQGGELIDSNWAPFGRGWFGEKNDRIYTARYRDSAGNIHEAHVKTSLFSGVYFTEDRIVGYAQPHPQLGNLGVEQEQQLQQENEQLRRQLAEIERKKV
jgi:hypothetical protein